MERRLARALAYENPFWYEQLERFVPRLNYSLWWYGDRDWEVQDNGNIPQVQSIKLEESRMNDAEKKKTVLSWQLVVCY